MIRYGAAFDSSDTNRTYTETDEPVRYEPVDDDMFEPDQDSLLY